jgi:hypothetical protein
MEVIADTENAPSPIFVTLFGIIASVNSEVNAKAFSPISVIVSEKEIVVKLAQSANAQSSISSKPEFKVTLVSPLPKNAHLPM